MMRGPEIYGRAPARVRWSPDGQWIYFSGCRRAPISATE